MSLFFVWSSDVGFGQNAKRTDFRILEVAICFSAIQKNLVVCTIVVVIVVVRGESKEGVYLQRGLRGVVGSEEGCLQ